MELNCKITLTVAPSGKRYCLIFDQRDATVIHNAAPVVQRILTEAGDPKVDRILCYGPHRRWTELCHDGERFTRTAPVADAEALALVQAQRE